MARRAKRRTGGPSYEEVKAQINAREEQRRLEKLRTSSNRILPIREDLLATTNDPEDRMIAIMDALSNTVTPVPDEGGLYTFIYNAKTPGIEYDQHPLIACVELNAWGFRGLNFHWRKYRNYTWNEVAGMLYEVRLEELDDLLALQYGKFILNR
jgi:hypothetical protein